MLSIRETDFKTSGVDPCLSVSVAGTKIPEMTSQGSVMT